MSLGSRLSDEVFLCIQKSRSPFPNLRHLLIDRRSGLPYGDVIGPALRLESMAFADRFAKTPGV